jgi:hypothetical protein
MWHYRRYEMVAPLALALLAPGSATGGEANPAAARFDVLVPFVDEPPVVDGILEERAWQSAAVLDGFVQTRPGDNTAPSRPTSVLLGYDATALYVGVRAGQDPRSVRATMARRDDVLDDDHVRLVLDTFHDQRRAYLLPSPRWGSSRTASGPRAPTPTTASTS